MSRKLGRYSKGEIAGILKGSTSANLDHKETQIRLIDVMNAMRALSPKQREAVFLVNVCQLTLREAADYCNVTLNAMWERHNRGLLNVVNYLNG